MEYREALLKVLIPMQMELDGAMAADEEPSPEDERLKEVNKRLEPFELYQCGNGEYVVEQTKGWDGTEYMPAFTVDIDENGKTYKYLINNDEFEAYLKIVKVDGKTGETIPYAGGTSLWRGLLHR